MRNAHRVNTNDTTRISHKIPYGATQNMVPCSGDVALSDMELSKSARRSEQSKSAEDGGDIINVDEDVDLEKMYLDLITEEYTSTVKR